MGEKLCARHLEAPLDRRREAPNRKAGWFESRRARVSMTELCPCPKPEMAPAVNRGRRRATRQTMSDTNRIAAAATPAEKLHEAIRSLRDVAEWLREQGEDYLADEADMVWSVYGPITAEQEALARGGAADTDEEFRERVTRHLADRPAPPATVPEARLGCGLCGDRHTAACAVDDDDGYREFP